MSRVHLQEELAQSGAKVTVETQHGTIRGRRAANGAAVFLGASISAARSSTCTVFTLTPIYVEVPYALPPVRFADPVPLPADFRYEDKEYILESKCR